MRLIPAVPDVNVRRMLEALRSDWLPSIPATEPVTVVGRGPRHERNSAAIPSLERETNQNKDESIALTSQPSIAFELNQASIF